MPHGFFRCASFNPCVDPIVMIRERRDRSRGVKALPCRQARVNRENSAFALVRIAGNP
jgi:hypothetical protein